MRFRLAELSDLKTVSTLFSLAVESMNRQQIFQWDEICPNEEILKKDIQQGEMYVGILDHQIAAVYVLNDRCDPEYQCGQWKGHGSYKIIHRLCIHPDFQNQGAATRTMLHIEQALKTDGIDAIRLDAFVQNPMALHLYEKLGYKIVGCVTWRKGDFFLMEKLL